MLLGLCLAIVCPVTLLFIRVGGCRIMYDSVTRHYDDWKRLNTLVATQETNSVAVTFISLHMILSTLYISLIQYLNNSVRKIGKNVYEVSYVINGKIYKMLVTPVRGRPPVVRITDENGEDATDMVRPYMGPKLDWHRTVFRPDFFNRGSLTFELSDGTSRTEDDVMPHIDLTRL